MPGWWTLQADDVVRSAAATPIDPAALRSSLESVSGVLAVQTAGTA